MHLSPSKGRILSKALMGLLALAPVARLCAQSNYSTPYAFTLIAGAGSPGTVDGTGNAAKFNQPYGIAIDSSGNLYVTDRSDQTVRKVTSGGVVTTIAGTAGLIGTTNATGTAALFNVPTGIAVGSGGDLYVCDTNNDTIRKITPAGVVSVFAGLAAEGGSLDGASGVGVLLAPQGVAVDSSGNVYVADTGNNSIRKVTSGGAITTLAGTAGTDTTDFVEGAPSTAGSTDGTGAGAEFNQPVGIAVDSSGNLYVADTGNDTIRKVTSGGVVTTIAGSPGQTGTADGTGSAARFKGPTGVAVDSNGNLYVADAGNSTIRKITPAGVVTTMAGLPANYAVVEGTGSAAIFDVPTGIAVDGNGNVFVTDKLGEVVQKGVVATVVTPPAVPVFTVQPLSVSVAGGPVVLNAAATGATSYQWYLNGTAISGETNPTTLIDDVSALNEGTYTCVATNSAGSVTSSAATVGLAVTSDAGHLGNISARAEVGVGGDIIFGGFVIGPIGTAGTLPVLIRASGPALVQFNVAGTLPDPQLQLFNSAQTVIDSNQAWGGNTAISLTAAAVSAFAWPSASSHDSALDLSLGTGTYTAQVSGESGDPGIGLMEVYDASAAGSFNAQLPHLVNLSARVDVGTGAATPEAGFVIQGNSALTVLIRVSGPALIPFGVSGTLADPEVTLQNPSTGAVYAQNAGWGGNGVIEATAASVGAFSWGTVATKDAAILVTLPPGSYTAAVQGISSDTGVVLVEVYEVREAPSIAVPATSLILENR